MPTSPPSSRRLPLATLSLSIAAIVVGFSPALATLLQYDRTALAAGQWWRMVTCHWTHFSADHLAWDVAAFTLLAAICERRGRGKMMSCILIASILIPAAVWVFLPHMQTYRGLSGIDSALFALLALDLLASHVRLGKSRWLPAGVGVMLVLFVAKIVTELVSGNAVFVNGASAGMIAVPLAHSVGAAVGCGTMFAFAFWRGFFRGKARRGRRDAHDESISLFCDQCLPSHHASSLPKQATS